MNHISGDFTVSQGVRDCDVFVPNTLTPQNSEELIFNVAIPALRVRRPGIERKTSRNPKMGKNGSKIEDGPRPEMGKKWPKNGPKTAKKRVSMFSPFLGHFVPMSGRGPFSFFGQILSYFQVSARFPFYTRPPHSQPLHFP